MAWACTLRILSLESIRAAVSDSLHCMELFPVEGDAQDNRSVGNRRERRNEGLIEALREAERTRHVAAEGAPGCRQIDSVKDGRIVSGSKGLRCRLCRERSQKIHIPAHGCGALLPPVDTR
jgi:hypothetical protein